MSMEEQIKRHIGCTACENLLYVYSYDIHVCKVDGGLIPLGENIGEQCEVFRLREGEEEMWENELSSYEEEEVE